MKILAIGDVVGETAAAWLAEQLPAVREFHAVDWIVVNAENCAVTGPSPMNGFGMTPAVLDLLDAGGVDVITGGNHSWDGEHTEAALSRANVVRPWNVEHPFGRGIVTVGEGESTLTVANMLSPTAQLPDMRAPQPRPIWPSWLELVEQEQLFGTVLIDLHGESTWEKMSFATAIDGRVGAVVGTHTHDASLRGHVLPRGTGYVTELGMTGHLGFTGGGFDPAYFAADFRGEDLGTLPPFSLATGRLVAGAMLIETAAGRAHSVTRIQLEQDASDTGTTATDTVHA